MDQLNAPEKIIDLNEEELAQVQEYKNNGLPMISKVTESDIFKWFELYMSGKQYNDIVEITNCEKVQLLYIAYRQDWCEKRQNYYNNIINGLSTKLTNLKLGSIDTVTTIVAALNKYYGNKFNRYLATNDNSIIDSLDTKLLSYFYKSIEAIERLTTIAGDSGGKGGGQSPLININLLGGKEIKTIDGNDQEFEITDENAEEILLALSSIKKHDNDKKM